MTSTNDGKEVKSNQTSGPKGKSYYIELYKSLDGRLSGECDLHERTGHLCEAWRRVHSLCQHSAPATHPHLLSWLQRHTAKTILQTKWQSSEYKDDQTRLEAAIDAFIEDSKAASTSRDGTSPPWESQLQQRGAWFKKILPNPWGHPVLRVLTDPRGQLPSDDEVLGWLKEERGVMFVTRLRQLAASRKCVDLALGLVSAVMDRVRATTVLVPDQEQAEEVKEKPKSTDTEPTLSHVLTTEAGFTVDVWELLTDIEFVLLHKLDRRSKCIELAKQTPLRNGYQLVERLQSRLETSPREKKLWKNAKEVATLIAQVVIARCMVVPACAGVARTALYCCARSLARLVPGARLPAAAAALAAPAATARHLHTLANAVDAQVGAEMKSFVCELYVRAITAGMNELERLKLKTEKESDARLAEQTLSLWFTQLGGVLGGSERIKCECSLTAFSMHPAAGMYDRIQAAPSFPPVSVDPQDVKEEMTSEFGSWANDSRTQTNLVKTSETLNMKQNQNKTNVLSIAILNEGEALGLSPELCQDLTVLLSGPRLKTLSWDMDRELLLDNCQAHMERTHGGTRTLTKELKYLNLDPSSYQHLPEEEDEETDAFYGIEKGYEHLVEQQEEIWDDVLFNDEMTESAVSSCIEYEIDKTVRRKKKVKKSVMSSDDDCNPLSQLRIEKKKERPHSKERKERKKKSKSQDSEGKDRSCERRKENSHKKEKKKETGDIEKKKERKPRKKKSKESKEIPHVGTKPGSLSRLIGLKVAKVKIPDGKNIRNCAAARVSVPCAMDNDYDVHSQGKSSLALLNSDGNDPDVLFDGLFSMDDYKSPERQDPLSDKTSVPNSQLSISNGQVANNTVRTPNKQQLDRLMPHVQYAGPVPPLTYTSPSGNRQDQRATNSDVREEVKKSITKLLEFRKQRAFLDEARKNMNTPTPSQCTNSDTTADPGFSSPNEITTLRKLPEQQIISPNAVEVPEIPKVFINKTQVERLQDLKNEVENYVSKYGHKSVGKFSTKQHVPKETPLTYNDFVKSSNIQQQKPTFDQLMNEHQACQKSKKSKNAQKSFQTKYVDSPSQKSFQDFLRELQESINAGTGANRVLQSTSDQIMPAKKDIKPASKVTPIILKTKADPASQSAKTVSHGKSIENQLNTFARLSYMHKTKQMESVQSHDQLKRALEEQKSAKLKLLQSKGEVVVSRVGNTVQNNITADKNTHVVIRKIEKTPSVAIKEPPVLSNSHMSKQTISKKTHPISDKLNMPLLSENLTNTAANPCMKDSSLSEKDQNDLILLLRQQNKLNTPPSTNMDPLNVSAIVNNPQYTKHLKASYSSNTVASFDRSVIKSNITAQSNNIITKGNHKSDEIKKAAAVMKNARSKTVECKTPKVQKNNTAPSNTNVTSDELVNTNPVRNVLVTSDTTLDTNSKQQDWEEVMNALLSHKTPSRGPNALNMALKKEKYSDSKLRSQRIVRPTKNDLNKTNAADDGEQHTLHNSAKSVIADIENEHVKIPSTKTSSSNVVKLHAQLSAPLTSMSLPKSEIHVIKPIVTTTSSTILSTNSTRTCDASKVRSIQIIQNDRVKKPDYNLLSKPAAQHYQKNQFGNDFMKEKDPFISGIPNSDYDLLEELMDDELRKEIGELSSDEDTYKAPALIKGIKIENVKCINLLKNSFVQQHEEQAVDLRCESTVRKQKRDPIIHPKSKKHTIRKNQKFTKPASSWTPAASKANAGNIVNKNQNSVNNKLVTTLMDINSSVCSANVNHRPASHVSSNITNEKQPHTIENNTINVVNPRNVVITVPQPAVQNVVLIGSELVYDAYSPLQSKLHTGLTSQASYVAFNSAPNIAVFQTTQFTTPEVNIIKSATNVPVSITATNASTSFKEAQNYTALQQKSEQQIDAMIKKATNVPVSITATYGSTSFKEAHNYTALQQKSEQRIDASQLSQDCPPFCMLSPQHMTVTSKIEVNTSSKQLLPNANTVVSVPLSESETTDVNFNKKCESITLLHVQEKLYTQSKKQNPIPCLIQRPSSDNNLKSDSIKELTKITNNSIDGDKTKPVIELIVNQDRFKERIKNKRLAIMNRELQHILSSTPIPLEYFSLKGEKGSAGAIKDKIPIKKCDKEQNDSTNFYEESMENYGKNDKEEDKRSKENSSNTSESYTSFLRSSDKDTPKNITPVLVKTKNSVGRKTKIRLKATAQAKAKIAEINKANELLQNTECAQKDFIKEELEKSDDAEINESPRRVSQRILKSKSEKDSAIIKPKSTEEENNYAINKLKSYIDEKDNDTKKIKLKKEEGIIVAPESGFSEQSKNYDLKPVPLGTLDLIDVEDELQGSKIPKTKSVFLNTENELKDERKIDLKNTESKTNIKTDSEEDLAKPISGLQILKATNRIEHSPNIGSVFDSQKSKKNKVNNIKEVIKKPANKNKKTIESIVNTLKTDKIIGTSISGIKIVHDISLDRIHKPTKEKTSMKPIIKEKDDDGKNKSNNLSEVKVANDITSNNPVGTDILKTVHKLNCQVANEKVPLNFLKQSKTSNEIIKSPRELKAIKSKTELQLLKDTITIEELPTEDLGKKCVRVKLPNGKIFKATVYGKMHVSIESLFSDATLKSMLLNSVTDSKRYTLNIKQVSTSDREDPSKIIDTRIEEINLQTKESFQTIETVNLLSDDEDEPAIPIFNTRFGNYKIPLLGEEELKIHQRKLKQKCVVKIEKLPFFYKESNTQHNEQIEEIPDLSNKDEILATKSTVNNSKPSNTVPEVIEIDDSSNDSIDIASDPISQHVFKELDIALPKLITPEVINKPEEKLIEFKNLLLKDLGVDDSDEFKNLLLKDLGVDDSEPLESPTIVSTVTQVAVPEYKTVIKTKDCFVKVSRCDNLIDKLNSACSVDFFRCDETKSHDNSDKIPELISSNEFVTIDDQEITSICETQRSRSGSFSLLNDFPFYTEEIPSMSPEKSYDYERSSPVIDVFETIATFKKYSSSSKSESDLKKDDLIQSYNRCVACCASWFKSKRQISLESKEGHLYHLPTFFKVPMLKTLTAVLFADYSMIEKYRPVIKKQIILSPSYKLKRKLHNIENQRASNKIFKLVDNSMVIQKSLIIDASCGEVRLDQSVNEDNNNANNGYDNFFQCENAQVANDKQSKYIGKCSAINSVEFLLPENKKSEAERNILEENIDRGKTEKDIFRIDNPDKDLDSHILTIKDNAMITDKKSLEEKQETVTFQNNESKNCYQNIDTKEVQAPGTYHFNKSTIEKEPGEKNQVIDNIVNEELNEGNVDNVTTDRETFGQDNHNCKHENDSFEGNNATTVLPNKFNIDVHTNSLLSKQNTDEPINSSKKESFQALNAEKLPETQTKNYMDTAKVSFINESKEIINTPSLITAGDPNVKLGMDVLVEVLVDNSTDNISNNKNESDEIINIIENKHNENSKMFVDLKEKFNTASIDKDETTTLLKITQVQNLDSGNNQLCKDMPEKPVDFTANSLELCMYDKNYDTNLSKKFNASDANEEENMVTIIRDSSIKDDKNSTDTRKSDNIDVSSFIQNDLILEPTKNYDKEKINTIDWKNISKTENSIIKIDYNSTGYHKTQQDSFKIKSNTSNVDVIYNTFNNDDESNIQEKDYLSPNILKDEIFNSPAIMNDALIDCKILSEQHKITNEADYNASCKPVDLMVESGKNAIDNSKLEELVENDLNKRVSSPHDLFDESDKKGDNTNNTFKDIVSKLYSDPEKNTDEKDSEYKNKFNSKIDVSENNNKNLMNTEIVLRPEGHDINLVGDAIELKTNCCNNSNDLRQEISIEALNQTNQVEIPVSFDESEGCSNTSTQKELVKLQKIKMVDRGYALTIKTNDDSENEDDINVNKDMENQSPRSIPEESLKNLLEAFEENPVNASRKEVTLVYKDGTDVVLRGVEYEDPVVGTYYVFPLAESPSLSSEIGDDQIHDSPDEIIQVTQEFNDDGTVDKVLVETKDGNDENTFKITIPKFTYSKVCNNSDIDYIESKSIRILKRKSDMSDVKVTEKRYRKGKNIDYPKITASTMIESAYAKEYKRLLDYCSSLKFSYTQPFHKELVDVEDIVKDWPITSSCNTNIQQEMEKDNSLFLDLIVEKDKYIEFNPVKISLAEEINAVSSEFQPSDIINETNFNMGFGEGSDRVIQNLEEVGDAKFSAATLSDVKQPQPFLLSEDYEDYKIDIQDETREDEIKKIKRHITYIQLREKVRLFFQKTTVELCYELINQNSKNNTTEQYKSDASSFPFDLYISDFIEPLPVETVVQVVQVGQLPVSTGAQNPVTCDPRVTQVSDASPSQCCVENSPQDDSQVTIKTEYTELTTADLNLPLVQDYARHEQTLPTESLEPCAPSRNKIVNIDTEIKSVVKIEMEEMPEIKEEFRETLDCCKVENPSPLQDDQDNIEYAYDTNNASNINTTPEFQDTNILLGNHPQNQDSEQSFSQQQKQQNGTPEKTDQIAHAMNAAGITTTAETISNNATRAHALVNILSQKIRQGTVNTSQASSTNFAKTTSINTMSLQQALAQILPPPLNQTSTTENNQHPSNITPQVLHIVQGKNANGSQITLLDNSQQSVINTPNATPVLHIVQNKTATTNSTSNGAAQPQTSFAGLSLVDAGLQQGGNQLLHIVNTGCQKNNNAAGQLLKRVNLLTNLTNIQGSNEQKMVQFVCKSADGKSIQLNAPHQRSMVLRLQPIETTNVQATPHKPVENHDHTELNHTNNSGKDNISQQEIKSRSVYEENYAKFIQSSSNKTTVPEKSTSLPKFNQAFGKPVFQDGSQKQNEISNTSHLTSSNAENNECQSTDNALHLEHIGQIGSPPMLIRKPSIQTSQSQSNFVQQIKQTIAPMNIQTMHGGVIYTRQIPVNIGGGQTINLITVPSTELMDDNSQKQSNTNHNEGEPSIIKIVPQNQIVSNTDGSTEDVGACGDNNTNQQTQPVLTQMRIKLPMLSKTPQIVSGTRVARPSFFQIQRNVIGGTNQPVYQQLVLTAAPPLGQQTIRLPQVQTNKQIKVPTDSQSSAESQMSSSTLEQLREFDMVLEQVKERSTVQPSSSTGSTFTKHRTSSTDTTDGTSPASSTSTESSQQALYSIGNNQPINVAYVNRKSTVATPTTSTYVRSPDSSGIVDSPTSSSQVQISHTIRSETTQNEQPPQPKPAKTSSKSKSKPKSTPNPPNSLKINTVIPKASTQKPLEDEQTTQRILYILAEYKEQVENSPDKDKPAPRRRTNPPSNPGSGSSKRKKSSSGCRRLGMREMSPIHGEDTCRTMGSEDSSCGTSQGDCNESCLDNYSPQSSPRKVARKISFEPETPPPQPRPQPQRNVIVADGQTITVARGTAGKPATAVLMPANYILPVSMVKGGQQIAIVTNRGPKLLTVGGGEGGTTNALLLQRLIGPAGLKPVLARPGVRHVRLPTAALHNLQAFNLATTTTIQPPDSTASPAPAPTPPELVDTRANSSPWADRNHHDVKPERASSPEGSEPWNLPAADYSYEETVRTEMDRTVLDPIPDRYSPDLEAQRIFDKMFDVESKKSYMGDSHDDSPRCAYDIDTSDCDDKAYHQVVQKKDGHRQHTRISHVSAAALRHKYAILEHELRLQKSLSEECEDLGVDSPSASDLFPEAELLFTSSPAHDHTQEHHSHTPQPTILTSSVPQPDIDDQIATDQLIPRNDKYDDQQDLNLGLEDVGIVTVSEDGMQATIALDHEEFARSHPNTTFHSEPTDEGVVVQQPYTITGLKGRHITSTIFHAGRAPATVLMTAPQTTVISQATADHTVKYADIDNVINSLPSANNNINIPSVLVKDDRLTRFDSILNDSRELHLSNTASAIVHSSGNATQVIRRVCYDDDRRDRFLMDEPDALIAGDDAKMVAEDSRDATYSNVGGDVEDDRSSPERHAELFWESNSMSERSESRRPLDFSSDSEKCCKSPSYDETNSTDSSGVGTHMRLDSVIKDARGLDRGGSADGSSADDTHPPLRTYPPKRLYHPTEGEMERSLSGKTRAGERSPDNLEVRRRASGRGVVKRGCHCCNGSPIPPRPKKSRQRKPAMEFTTN